MQKHGVLSDGAFADHFQGPVGSAFDFNVLSGSVLARHETNKSPFESFPGDENAVGIIRYNSFLIGDKDSIWVIAPTFDGSVQVHYGSTNLGLHLGVCLKFFSAHVEED